MIVAILQARMTSSRLPGKVMKPILGMPMIGRHIERLNRCDSLDRIVVATSKDASDDGLAAYCEGLGVRVFRGSLDDVLGRFQGAATVYGAEHVVRLTADCPLADPDVIDATIDLHLSTGADYASNSPDGAAFPRRCLGVAHTHLLILRDEAAQRLALPRRPHVVAPQTRPVLGRSRLRVEGHQTEAHVLHEGIQDAIAGLIERAASAGVACLVVLDGVVGERRGCRA